MQVTCQTSPDSLVETALFAFAKRVRDLPVESDGELEGVVRGFCLDYPAIHKALTARELVDNLAGGYVGFRRRAFRYLDETRNGWAVQAKLEAV